MKTTVSGISACGLLLAVLLVAPAAFADGWGENWVKPVHKSSGLLAKNINNVTSDLAVSNLIDSEVTGVAAGALLVVGEGLGKTTIFNSGKVLSKVRVNKAHKAAVTSLAIGTGAILGAGN